MKITAPLPPDAAQLLRARERAGVYRCEEETARALFHAGPAAGFNVYRIDLAHAKDAESLHDILARALHFPDWYGANWDALADSLADLSWHEADGYLLILQGAEHLQIADAACYTTLLDVLKNTVMAWQAQKIAFWALLPDEHPELPAIGVLT